MKYLKLSLILFSCAFLLTLNASAQKPKPKRPARNQPQYPHIIDTGERPTAPAQTESGNPPTENAPTLTPEQQQDLLLVKAVVGLTLEVRSLVQEMKALNVRQQAQLDMLRLSRVDLRVDQFDRELKSARDRLALLEAEEQNLNYFITPESLNTQVANIPTFDKSTTIRQLKANHEARLRVVQTEKELTQKRVAELAEIVESFRATGSEAEKRLQAAEEILRQLESLGQEKPKPPLPDKP